ncbi:MAG TPA: cytochrome c oxidase subunit I [Trueperaceae bacterium]|nr:cytochrome c oxidase subunit I [Trueperaceae bacterium]
MESTSQAVEPAHSKLFMRPTWTTGFGSWLTTVDHKKIGILYMLSSFTFMGAASVEAFIMRLQLMRPGQQLVSPDVFNQLFTMHGVTMVFLAIMPLGIGFANYFVPLMIGARDLAFPRLNAFGYWVYALGGLMIYSSFFLGGAPDVGWVAYAPLTSLSNNPGFGVDFYVFGLFLSGVGTTVTAMNLIVTIVNMRAPGMTFMRMPVFPWLMLITSFMIIFAFPPLTIAFLELIVDRTFGSLFFVPAAGALPILWQHLFWIFGHPEVYIIIMPAFGMISEMIPTFSRKPLFGYPVMILASILIAFMGFAVWTHHMFTTGLGPVVNTAFSLTSFIIGIPTGVKIFNWLGTLWGGSIRFTVPLLYSLAFIVTFTLGGITGIMVAMPTFDAQVHDTYFVVAHFHYVMGGGALLTFLGALYYWFPKMTGRLLDERVGKIAWGFIVVGFHTIFFPQHIAGMMGMPRRIQTYPDGIGLEIWNFASSFGTFIMGVGMILVLGSVIYGLRRGPRAGNDPWDARTLEWATTSPPPYYNFKTQPVVNSLDAFWAWKHPESLNVDPIDPATAGKKYDAHGIHIPGQSWYPLLASAALIVGSYGLIYDNWILAIVSGFAFIFCIFGWAFEGVGGHHAQPELEGEAV